MSIANRDPEAPLIWRLSAGEPHGALESVLVSFSQTLNRMLFEDFPGTASFDTSVDGLFARPVF